MKVCARCTAPATSEIITLKERLLLCARCVAEWWREFTGGS